MSAITRFHAAADEKAAGLEKYSGTMPV